MFRNLKQAWIRLLKSIGFNDVDSLPREEIEQGQLIGYKLVFMGDREAHTFRELDDEGALREMCRYMGISHPPNVLQFKARGGSALYRLLPAQKIFPADPVRISRAGVARSYPEEHRPRMPTPV